MNYNNYQNNSIFLRCIGGTQIKDDNIGDLDLGTTELDGMNAYSLNLVNYLNLERT